MSQARSAALSHFACAGVSVSPKKNTTPSSTAGMPPTMNTQRQPSNPSAPSKVSRIQPLSGLPSTLATGIATMTVEITLVRSAFGYQRVRYTMMPGKKPASATPSRKRSR
nr:hypothetical protein [Nocardia brasiliensis]